MDMSMAGPSAEMSKACRHDPVFRAKNGDTQMTMQTLTTPLLAVAMVLATGAFALAQTSDDDHAAHHPDAENGATVTDDAPQPGMMNMMGMMTPEMMQMMMRMMPGAGLPADGTTAPGMAGMAGMSGGRMAPGMMGGSAMPMGQMMQGQPGAMVGHGLGPHALYGRPQDAMTEMTPARVEVFLTQLLEQHANSRLALGTITQAGDGNIIAEIVTIDGSLVQRLSFNRYPGLFRRID
jgi:hypothetical protein